MQQDLRFVFKGLDKNGDGMLTLEELLGGMHDKDFPYSDETIAKFFKQADSNGDGLLSFDEFEAMVKRALNSKKQQIFMSTFDEIDVEKKGWLNREQLVEFLRSADMYTDVNIEELFKQIDENGDGKIQPSEMLAYLSRNGKL